MKSTTKVLFYFGGFSPTGGIETFCKNLLSYLQEQEYICTLIFWGKESLLIRAMRKKGVKIIRLFWRFGCRWNLPDWILLSFSLSKLESFNIILFGKLFPLPILKAIRKKVGQTTKLVYITPYKPSIPENPIQKQITLEMLNIFDTVLVQSHSFTKNLRDIGYVKRIEILPYMLNEVEKPKPLPRMNVLKIGFLGRLVDDKNLPLLLQSFYCLRQRNNFSMDNQVLSLNIFGDGHLQQSLEDFSYSLGIRDSVIFHGCIPNEQVKNAIDSCHLFVFTSHVEGQCLAALEILACGRPIVSTNAGALPEILADQRLGRLVTCGTPEGVCDAISEVSNALKQLILTPEIIFSAYLERYETSKIGNFYIKIIDSLI